MSTEQDKDSFSIKRNRGGDGSLDGLGGPGLHLGSPDKKKRKSSTQTPSFAPLSEYAPPPNPSSDHLVASNPFDDNFNPPPLSLKSLNSTNPYFSLASHYPGFSGYGPSRMAAHIQSRMPAPFGLAFQIRNQPHPFVQNPTGFNRAPGFNYAHPETPGFANQAVFNNSGGMHQHVRPGPGENISQIPLSNMNQNLRPNLMLCSPDCGNRPAARSGPGTSPGVNFAQSVIPKQEPGESRNKSATPPRKPNLILEEGRPQESHAEFEGKTRSNAERGMEKINGVLHPNTEPLKKSPQAVTENSGEKTRRAANSKSGKRNRLSGSAPSEPLYPCGICLGEVKDDQEAILCEASCQKWFHRVCTGMTETAYHLLTAEAAAVWGCDACMDKKEGAQLLKTREASGLATTNSGGQT